MKERIKNNKIWKNIYEWLKTLKQYSINCEALNLFFFFFFFIQWICASHIKNIPSITILNYWICLDITSMCSLYIRNLIRMPFIGTIDFYYFFFFFFGFFFREMYIEPFFSSFFESLTLMYGVVFNCSYNGSFLMHLFCFVCFFSILFWSQKTFRKTIPNKNKKQEKEIYINNKRFNNRHDETEYGWWQNPKKKKKKPNNTNWARDNG